MNHAIRQVSAMSETNGEVLLCLVILRYLVNEEQILESLVDHRSWLKRWYDEGVILFSGRQDPPNGGVLAFRAANREAARAFLDSDPFTRNAVAEYDLVAVAPTPAPWRRGDIDEFLTST